LRAVSEKIEKLQRRFRSQSIRDWRIICSAAATIKRSNIWKAAPSRDGK